LYQGSFLKRWIIDSSGANPFLNIVRGKQQKERKGSSTRATGVGKGSIIAGARARIFFIMNR